MGSLAIGDETGPLVYPLSALDHLSPRTHTPKLLYFACTADPDLVIATVRNALAQTIAALPIIAGSVGLLDHASQAGSLAVQAPYFTADDLLAVKDLRREYQYTSLRAKEFPPDAVDGSLVIPDLMRNPAQVMVAQANLIEGGLILVCAIHHCVMDETGIFKLIELWAASCRGDIVSTLVKDEWLNRGPLLQGSGTGRLEEHPEYKLLPAAETATGRKKPAQYLAESSEALGAAVFFFSDESLERLKKAATKAHRNSSTNGVTNGAINVATNGHKNGLNGTHDAWISTNDALCALMWCSITSARKAAGIESPYSMFNMALNGRSRLNPPMSLDFTGNVVFVTKAFKSFEYLTSSEPSRLADAALVIRNSVIEIDDKKIKDVISIVRGVDDIGRLCPGGYSSAQRHVGCTSWSRQPYYTLEWGDVLGGNCKRIRWRSTITDGIFAIFPHLPESEEFGPGGLEVCLGLQHEHLKRLQKDETFNQYAQWRCS